MKKLIFSLIFGIFCMAALGQTIQNSPIAEQTDANATNKEESIENDSIKNDALDDDNTVISDTGNFYIEELYKTPWFIYITGGIAIVALILSVVTMHTQVPERDIDKLKARISDLEKSIDYQSQNRQPTLAYNANQSKDIDDLKRKLKNLENEIDCLKQKDLKQPSILQPQNTNGNTVITSHPTDNKPVNTSQRVLYAVQNASNEMELINVSETQDKYTHTFIITLDKGSNNTGTFRIIDEEFARNECLSNTDSIRCCEKIGYGSRIIDQTPGQVIINGNTAIVKKKAIITLK